MLGLGCIDRGIRNFAWSDQNTNRYRLIISMTIYLLSYRNSFGSWLKFDAVSYAKVLRPILLILDHTK